jgi:RNA polymerase sporulation-specific sigma factor
MLDYILIKEEFEELSRVLNTRLTPLERSVFEKRAEEDSYKDIAKALGQTPKAVDNALMRIRKKAREVLECHDKDMLEQSFEYEMTLEIIIEEIEGPE